MQKTHEILKKLRLAADKTQGEIAAEIGTSQAYYNSLECGRRKIGLKMIGKISKVYGVGVDQLLGFTGIDNNHLQTRMLPVLGTTQAGDWRTIVPNWGGETLPATSLKGSPNAFYLKVEGDSMSPQIEHGDYVVIDPDQQVGSNEIGLFVYEESTTIKRLQKDAGKSYLVPDNPQRETITATENTYCIGRVLQAVRTRSIT